MTDTLLKAFPTADESGRERPDSSARNSTGSRLPSARAVRPRTGSALALLVILFVGFTFRFWMAASTYSPDAATLAWGSAQLAAGHLDPYHEVVAHSINDPIPLNSIHSLSLAQGPLGVVAGAIPLFVAEHTGLLHFGNNPNGHAFGTGELFAYKLGYLLPELLIVGCICAMAPSKRRRLQVLSLWASSPLLVYAWGQGLPDMWTIAVMLLAILLLERAAASELNRRGWRYGIVAALVLIGGSWTKLLPVILLLPVFVLVARDKELGRRRLQVVLLAALGLGLAVFPYLLSPYMRANVLVRFEFDMLDQGGGISPTGSAVQAAFLGAMLVLAVTAWLFSERNPIRVVRTWTIVVVLAISALSGGITHLFIWSLLAIILIGLERPRAAMILSGAFTTLVVWHVASHRWLFDLFDGSFARAAGWDRGYDVLGSVIPGFRVLGTYCSSAVLLACLWVAWLLFDPIESAFVRRSRNWSSGDVGKATAGTLGAVSIVALIGAIVIGGWATAVSGATLGGVYQDSSESIALSPTAALVVPTRAHGKANTLLFRVDVESQPAAEKLQFEILRGSKPVSTATTPLWQADALSDRGVVRVSLNPPVEVGGATLRITRVPEVGMPTGQRAYVSLTASKVDSVIAPAVEFSSSDGPAFFQKAFRSQIAWYRISGLPVLALLLALAVEFVIRRRSQKD